jgi:hypothetical protein
LFCFGYSFIGFIPLVAAQCGTLLQPMPVKDLSTTSSIGRSLVMCQRGCIVILLNCHRDYAAVYRKKQIWDAHVKQIINMSLGLGKESGGGYFKFG